MVQRADAAEAQDRRDLCVFILEENELKSTSLVQTDVWYLSLRQLTIH